ncbi:MAG: TIGR02453 family protein [Desulfovibrio sp.]|nr:TIGR02453 family protein [Desulfovibrio sp.]MBI4960544.1 TIGR02453 family protein [Desulfovibrio sp.]
MKGAFQGFSEEAFTFFRTLNRLQADFNFDGAREYYLKNKPLYEREVKAPLGALVEELSAAMKEEAIPVRGDRLGSLFRINRDIRFSPDKSPYKTHAGAVLTPTGSKKEQGVLYIHIDPTGCLMAAGFYRPEPKELAKLREYVRKYPKKFDGMVKKLASHGLRLDPDDTLKRLPRGFEDVDDPELAKAVKLKGYTVMKPLADKEVMSAGLIEHLRVFARQVLPLLEFGWEALRRED